MGVLQGGSPKSEAADKNPNRPFHITEALPSTETLKCWGIKFCELRSKASNTMIYKDISAFLLKIPKSKYDLDRVTSQPAVAQLVVMVSPWRSKRNSQPTFGGKPANCPVFILVFKIS